MGPDDIFGPLAAEGRFAGEDLPQDDSKGVEVTAGAQRFTSVTLSGGLSETEIERIIRDGSDSAATDPTDRGEPQNAPAGSKPTTPDDPRAIPLEPEDTIDAEPASD